MAEILQMNALVSKLICIGFHSSDATDSTGKFVYLCTTSTPSTNLTFFQYLTTFFSPGRSQWDYGIADLAEGSGEGKLMRKLGCTWLFRSSH